jgi:putative oxidoreductase
MAPQFGNFDYRAAIARPARIVVPILSDSRGNDGLFEKCRDFAARHVLFLSRLSLATVFFWFGVLKVANVSPVTNLLRAAFPFLAETPYLEILGIAEIVIGVGLLMNRLTKQATFMMILHLLGTLSLFIIAPRLIFAPTFPVLTMDGEFVLKNVVLITSALVIMLLRPRTTA